MSSDTLVPEMKGAVGEGITGAGVLEEVSVPVIRAPDFNPCYNYAESVNPLFDPGGSCFVAPFSSTRIAPNTCRLATTLPATI